MTSGALDGWTPGSFTAGGITRATYRRGTGPGVIVIHEIPGITPKVTEFANDVVAAGFTVVMPLLVGKPGKARSGGYMLGSMLRICIAREFTTWATGRTSPIVSYLQALAKSVHEECGGPGVGAIGMCFSGGFALGMMVDGHVAAPVLSQPSLPFAKGGTKKGRTARGSDLNLSPADRAAMKAQVDAGCGVLGLRFDQDELVGTRFATLHELLGTGFVAVDLPSHQPRDHSVLTEERDEATVHQVLDFLRTRLVQ